jgi:hypothetical protein
MGWPPLISARYFSSDPSDSTSRWTPCPPEYYRLLSGQRGITPAFGYGAPHPGPRGTLTLLSNVLLRTPYDPLRVPVGPLPLSKALELALHSNGGSPHWPRPPSRHAVPATPVDRAGAPVGDFPARTAFPVPGGGSASTTSLSRPAQASLVLRPAGLLNHLGKSGS